MMKLTCLSILFALSTFAASSAQAEDRADERALFDRCVEATKRFQAAPKALDLDLLELAMDGAEKGNMQCTGLAQNVLLQHARRLDRLSAEDRARAEKIYARGFKAWGTPELASAATKLPVLASAR
jgi:hypothetical protein